MEIFGVLMISVLVVWMVVIASQGESGIDPFPDATSFSDDDRLSAWK